MDEITRLGVFATERERDEIAALALDARHTPAILMGGLGRPDAATLAYARVADRIAEIAASHGLPLLPEWQQYGMDPRSGEFVRKG